METNVISRMYIVLTNEQGDWLAPSNVVDRIKNGEDFDFNARLNADLIEDSIFIRLNSKDENLKIKRLREKK